MSIITEEQNKFIREKQKIALFSLVEMQKAKEPELMIRFFDYQTLLEAHRFLKEENKELRDIIAEKATPK